MKKVLLFLFSICLLCLNAQTNESCDCIYPNTEIKWGSFGKLSNVIDDKLSKYFREKDSFDKHVYYTSMYIQSGRYILELVNTSPFIYEDFDKLFSLNLSPCYSKEKSYRLKLDFFDSKQSRRLSEDENNYLNYSFTIDKLKFIVDTNLLKSRNKNSKSKDAPFYFIPNKNIFSFREMENKIYIGEVEEFSICQDEIEINQANIKFKTLKARLELDNTTIMSDMTRYASSNYIINTSYIINHNRYRRIFQNFKGIVVENSSAELTLKNKNYPINLIKFCANNSFIYFTVDLGDLLNPENKVQLEQYLDKLKVNKFEAEFFENTKILSVFKSNEKYKKQ